MTRALTLFNELVDAGVDESTIAEIVAPAFPDDTPSVPDECTVAAEKLKGCTLEDVAHVPLDCALEVLVRDFGVRPQPDDVFPVFGKMGDSLYCALLCSSSCSVLVCEVTV